MPLPFSPDYPYHLSEEAYDRLLQLSSTTAVLATLFGEAGLSRPARPECTNTELHHLFCLLRDIAGELFASTEAASNHEGEAP